MKAKAIGLLGILAALAALCFACYQSGAEHVQVQFDAFKLTQKALANQQAQANQAKEAEHAAQIKSAELARDAALDELRKRQRAGANILPPIPAGARAPETICFERAGFDAAFRGIEGLIAEGDQAVIDDRAWLAAWPQ